MGWDLVWEPRPRGDGACDERPGLISRCIAPGAALPQSLIKGSVSFMWEPSLWQPRPRGDGMGLGVGDAMDASLPTGRKAEREL